MTDNTEQIQNYLYGISRHSNPGGFGHKIIDERDFKKVVKAVQIMLLKARVDEWDKFYSIKDNVFVDRRKELTQEIRRLEHK